MLKPADEGFEGVLGVGGAGVGDDEDVRRADGAGLEAELGLLLHSLGVAEVVGVDGEALEADDGGSVLQDFLLQEGRAFSIVPGAEGGGLTGRSLDQVGEADAVVGEAVVVFHRHGAIDEAGLVEGAPEAVAGVGEISAALDGDLGGVESNRRRMMSRLGWR